MRDQLHLLAATLSPWQHPVASSEALDLLHRVMHAVIYQRIIMAIKLATKAGVLLHRCFVCCCPGGCWGDTEQEAAQWQRPEASGVALNMLHWEKRAALHPHIRMAINIASKGGTFVPHCQFCHQP
jgi:hypothetical protein